jgi:hypothetical protein
MNRELGSLSASGDVPLRARVSLFEAALHNASEILTAIAMGRAAGVAGDRMRVLVSFDAVGAIHVEISEVESHEKGSVILSDAAAASRVPDT